MRYILVEWPKSQQFMEDDRCLPCIEIDGAIFVPENVYDYYVNGNVKCYLIMEKVIRDGKDKKPCWQKVVVGVGISGVIISEN